MNAGTGTAGDALVAASIVAMGLMALIGATMLSWWLSDEAPLAGLAVVGVAMLLLCGLWLRSLGI